MDLNVIEVVDPRPTRAAIAAWSAGDAWLGGGSWLFSEPQPRLRRLFDLDGFAWTPLAADAAGLEIAATCRIADLQAWSGALPDWTAAPLIGRCCRALLGSFKVWNVATVGGNMCLGLPAGPMTSLAVALDGRCLVWAADEERTIAAVDFVQGERVTALRPGEILRSILLPAAALRRRTAFRQISLSPLGRSGALLVGTLDREGGFALTVTASTVRPYRIDCSSLPDAALLAEALDETIPADAWHDDVHGTPGWRRHVTGLFAREILDELAGSADSVADRLGR